MNVPKMTFVPQCNSVYNSPITHVQMSLKIVRNRSALLMRVYVSDSSPYYKKKTIATVSYVTYNWYFIKDEEKIINVIRY